MTGNASIVAVSTGNYSLGSEEKAQKDLFARRRGKRGFAEA